MTIQYLDALCGSGKTRSLAQHAARLAREGHKVLFVQPTCELINRTIEDEFPTASSITITAIHSGRRAFGSSTVAKAVEHFKAAQSGGEVLFLTHACFNLLPFIERKHRWTLLMDEVPQVDVFEALNLPDTHHLITRHLDLEPTGAAYGRLCARTGLDRIVRNEQKDDVLAAFHSFAGRIASDHWDVFADQRQFERLTRGEKTDCRLATYALLKPSIFNGFMQVIVASACMPDTMFFRLFDSQGVKLESVGGRLADGLRYQQHPHGERIRIFYATDEAWSKRFRDREVTDAKGNSVRFIDQIKGAIDTQFGDEGFLWMGNKDLADSFFSQPEAQRLPNTPHGFNGYQGYHNVVVLSALNPPPQHFNFLRSHGISGEEVRTAHYRSAAYQATMRGSIRNPNDATPKKVVVMDRDTADWLADLFPGAQVEALPGVGASPSKGQPGRRRLHASNAERQAAFRARQKRKDALMQENERINGGIESGQGCNENPLYTGDNVTTEPADLKAGSAFSSIYDIDPIYVEYGDHDAFIAGLRGLHKDTGTKEEAGLISPAKFDPNKAWDTSRGLANIEYLRGIWLDNDGGDLTHAEFADLFPDLRIAVFNTYSSTPEKPRWRAFIPTTSAFGIETHSLIMEQIKERLRQQGFQGKKASTANPTATRGMQHGFDESKFVASSMFYLPCQAAHPKGSFFIDYGEGKPNRQPLDPNRWIEHSIVDEHPEPILVPESTSLKTAALSPLERMRHALATQKNRITLAQQGQYVSKALDEWRSTPRGMGNNGFFCLGVALRCAGLDDAEIRSILYDAARYAHSPKERRSEINGIMRSLRH